MARSWGIVVWRLVLAALVSLLVRLVPPARAQTASDLELSEKTIENLERPRNTAERRTRRRLAVLLELTRTP